MVALVNLLYPSCITLCNSYGDNAICWRGWKSHVLHMYVRVHVPSWCDSNDLGLTHQTPHDEHNNTPPVAK